MRTKKILGVEKGGTVGRTKGAAAGISKESEPSQAKTVMENPLTEPRNKESGSCVEEGTACLKGRWMFIGGGVEALLSRV